jgi:hypothetical protein
MFFFIQFVPTLKAIIQTPLLTVSINRNVGVQIVLIQHLRRIEELELWDLLRTVLSAAGLHRVRPDLEKPANIEYSKTKSLIKNRTKYDTITF